MFISVELTLSGDTRTLKNIFDTFYSAQKRSMKSGEDPISFREYQPLRELYRSFKTENAQYHWTPGAILNQSNVVIQKITQNFTPSCF